MSCGSQNIYNVWSGASIAGITLTKGGSGYTSAPNVIIIGGGGDGATAVAFVSGGAVINLQLTNGGANYTTPLTVEFIGGGDGTGAEATAALDLTTKCAPTRFLYVQLDPEGGAAVGGCSNAQVSAIVEWMNLFEMDSIPWGKYATVGFASCADLDNPTITLTDAVTSSYIISDPYGVNSQLTCNYGAAFGETQLCLPIGGGRLGGPIPLAFSFCLNISEPGSRNITFLLRGQQLLGLPVKWNIQTPPLGALNIQYPELSIPLIGNASTICAGNICCNPGPYAAGPNPWSCVDSSTLGCQIVDVPVPANFADTFANVENGGTVYVNPVKCNNSTGQYPNYNFTYSYLTLGGLCGTDEYDP